MQMVFMQLPLCGLDPLSLSEKLESDDFALGYVFGLADMGNYQFNRETNGQEVALNYILNVFVETLGSGGEGNFSRALQIQNQPEFAAGRQTGADELGNWVKSQGRTSALGLASHFGSF